MRGDAFEVGRAAVEDEPPAPSALLTDDRRRRVRGDLDAIVLRALRKDPGDRYPSAVAFADDLGGWLRSEPVTARSAGVAYRARLFARRRRASVAATAAALLALGGLGAFHADRITRERNRAEMEAEKAAEVREFLLGLFTSSLPTESLGGTLRVRDLLDRGVARADSLTDRPELRALLLATLGDVYRALGRFDLAGPLLDEAVSVYRGTAAEPLDLAAALTGVAMLRFDLRQYEAALEPTREALEIQREALGPDHPDVLSSLGNLATLTARAGDVEEALRLHHEILAARERTLGPDDPAVAVTLNNIGFLLYGKERYDEAEGYFRRALDLWSRVLPPTHPDVPLSMSNLASLYRDVGRLDEAEPLYLEALELRERVLGPDHPRLAITLYSLAQLLKTKGDLPGAERHFRAALRIDRAAYGPDHAEVAVDSYQLALVLLEGGDCRGRGGAARRRRADPRGGSGR